MNQGHRTHPTELGWAEHAKFCQIVGLGKVSKALGLGPQLQHLHNWMIDSVLLTTFVYFHAEEFLFLIKYDDFLSSFDDFL